MAAPGPTIDLAGSAAPTSCAMALRDVVGLLEGWELTPAMGRWTRRLAATFSSWHDAVVRAMETHPALSCADPAERTANPDTYLASIRRLTCGLGPRAGRSDVVPVAVALVELAGTFGPTFAPLRRLHPEVHDQLALAVDLAPAPFGAAGGLTTRFVDGLLAVATDLSAPGRSAADVRARIDAAERETLTAIGELRRAGSKVHGVARSQMNGSFDPARVAALAAVLAADEGFCAPGGAEAGLERAGRVGPLALAATGDFAAVARTDERIAAGLTVADGGPCRGGPSRAGLRPGVR